MIQAEITTIVHFWPHYALQPSHAADLLTEGPFVDHEAIRVAIAQAHSDLPMFDEYRATMLATEESRYLVVVYLFRDNQTVRPNPCLYGVSSDCKTARRLDDGEGARFGYHPESRK